MAFSHPDYTIVRELGRGGSATVYLGVQNTLNRRVAIKVLHGAGADPSHGERFLREGRIVAKLNHPHIVPVYDVGTGPDDSTSYFMTMEYLPEGNLSERIADFSLDDLFITVAQICAALTYAHEQGFVHRDVKPDNILFRGPGEALLADFGIARATESLTQMTMTGAMLGTPDYMSPEQVTGGAIDHRSDLYSLGVVLFELLAGYKPLQGDSVMSTGLQHIAAAPLQLPDNVAHFQPLLDTLLAKKPEERPQSAAEFAQTLADLVGSWSVDKTQPLTSLYSGEEPLRASIESALTVQRTPRKTMPIAIAAVVAALAVGLGLWVFNPGISQPPTALPVEPDVVAPSELQLTLNAAQEAFRLDKWFGEEGDAAVNLYRAALTLAPDHAVASQRLEDMFTTTQQRAMAALARNDVAGAQPFITSLQTGWADDPRVTSLEEQLDATRQKIARAQDAAAANARITSLLQAANNAMSRGALLTPPGESAADYYRQILTLDANNVLAQAGISSVADQLFNQAENALGQRAFDSVDTLLADAAQLTPDAQRLVTLRTRVINARAQADMDAVAQAEQAELTADINDLASRVDDWMGDEGSALDAVFESLSLDMATLLGRAPDNPELRSLQSVAQRHADRLASIATDESAGEAQSAGEDDDRFRFGSF